ncbi:nuclear transport factor 2 family protein [Streptomyces sp. WAC08241]|uniref:nuclear transport factor 2 family protein n=1 Tax=Streptomyces sp. WAC08241 TaxID=2487421 RepID=UPI00163D1F2D|nr:nuclear transport factor 2 family protein [Streptomyces sp. WAC08241]
MNSVTTAAEISTLLDRYLLGLDDEKLDDAWARALFSDDARVEFPMARHEGVEGLADWHRQALDAFARTQHLHSPAVVDLTGDERAVLRANLVSTHVHHPGTPGDPLFVAGTLVRGEARPTERGWRLTDLAFRPVWTTGTPPRAGDAR